MVKVLKWNLLSQLVAIQPVKGREDVEHQWNQGVFVLNLCNLWELWVKAAKLLGADTIPYRLSLQLQHMEDFWPPSTPENKSASV